MRLKTILFSIAPLLVLLLVGEVGLRMVYFQTNSKSDLALVGAYKHIRNIVLRKKAERIAKESPLPPDYAAALYTSDGVELLKELQDKYAGFFKTFSDQVRASDARHVVIYLPDKLE